MELKKSALAGIISNGVDAPKVASKPSACRMVITEMTHSPLNRRQLSPVQRNAIIIAAVLQIGLLGAALWDLHRRSPDEIRGSKRLWQAVSFINFIGPITYFLLGRKPSADNR